MQRLIGACVFNQPIAHLPNHAHIVGICRNDKINDFEPYPFLSECPDRVEDRLKFAGVQLRVYVLAEALEIDMSGVDVLAEIEESFLLDVATTNPDIFQPAAPRQFCCVVHIFEVACRFRIGVCDSRAVGILSHRNDIFREHTHASDILLPEKGELLGGASDRCAARIFRLFRFLL